MTYYYAAETGGFYSDDIHGPRQIAQAQTPAEIKAGKRALMIDNPDCKVPASAIAITKERWQELMAAQAKGMAITAVGGKPVAVEPTISIEQQIIVRRRQRDKLLAASDWTQMADSPLGEASKAAWAVYRQALRDLDMSGADWPVEPGSEAA